MYKKNGDELLGILTGGPLACRYVVVEYQESSCRLVDGILYVFLSQVHDVLKGQSIMIQGPIAGAGICERGTEAEAAETAAARAAVADQV